MWYQCSSLPIAIAIAIALALAPACSDDGGGDGTGDGMGDSSGSDAGPPPDASAACVGAPLPFMCPCNVADDMCDAEAGDMCFNFNAKGPHCTHACDGPEDCPAPSAGCNNMGVCKAPD